MIWNSIKIRITRMMQKRRFGSLGNGSYLIAPMRLIGTDKIFIGDNVVFFNNARIEAESEYYGTRYDSKITIGDGTSVQQNVHITCASAVNIGKKCAVLPDVLITDINHPYTDINKPPAEQELEVKPVEIGDECMIGMGARIMPGVRMGKHCVVGTNAVVTGGVYPDYSVIAGIPGRIIKRYNTEIERWENCKKQTETVNVNVRKGTDF